MKIEPKVSHDEYLRQTMRLYADIGQVVVHAEHLNHAIIWCCSTILELQGLPQSYAHTIFAGQNVEASRRHWVALTKQRLQGDKTGLDMVEHISKRISAANDARNQIVHQRWFIGWGNKETESFEVAKGQRTQRDYKKGGTKYLSRDSKHFEELVKELQILNEIVMCFMACIDIQTRSSSTQNPRGKFENNFHYIDDKLVPGKKPE